MRKRRSYWEESSFRSSESDHQRWCFFLSLHTDINFPYINFEIFVRNWLLYSVTFVINYWQTLNLTRIKEAFVNTVMSGYVRRAFSYRNMLWVRASCVFRARDVSTIKICDSSRVFTVPATPNFVAESRRAYAKGRKSSTSLLP